MQKISIIILSLLISVGATAQSLKKYSISNSGCSVYMFCNPGAFELTYSQDSARVYSAECSNGDISYSVICVKLSNPMSELDIAEGVLEQYLDFLKGNFKITKSVGYGKGHHLRDNERTRGIIDYWEDEEKYSWKVKGWTDGKYLCVLCAYSKTELPESKINIFLDGLVLPGS